VLHEFDKLRLLEVRHSLRVIKTFQLRCSLDFHYVVNIELLNADSILIMEASETCCCSVSCVNVQWS